MPEYDPAMKVPYAFVVKINDFGKFAHKPTINSTYKRGSLQPMIDLSSDSLSTIYYTIDGSSPTASSLVYKKPFSISKTADVKAIALMAGALPSDVADDHIIKYNWIPAENPGDVQQGISYNYYEPGDNSSMTSSLNSKIIASGVSNTFSLDKKQRKEKFAFDFTGYIKIMKDGQYTFYTSSDDGSKLFIDDMEVVDNDGEHGEVEKSGIAFLKKGYHKIEVKYFDSSGGNTLKVSMQAEGKNKQEISGDILFH